MNRENNKVFVACPIGGDGSDIRQHADKVWNQFIKPVCEKLDLHPDRSDKIPGPSRISADIIKRLDSGVVVIADLTGCNPNVMYELGVRDGLGQPAVLMALEGTKLPFDLSDFRTIFFNFDPGHRSRIRKELAAHLQNALEGKTEPVIQSVLCPKAGHHGVSLEGDWYVRFPDIPHEREIEIELKHSGAQLSGYSAHTKKSDEGFGELVRKYKLSGTVSDRMVCLQGKLCNSKGIGMNTFLMEITHDGDDMKGWFTAYSGLEQSIVGLSCIMHRHTR